MADDLIKDIRERLNDANEGWREIHEQGEIDMQYVSGNPWDSDDREARKGRPTIAPDELSQYTNQVINALRSDPIGMKFDPTGNGASEKGAEFYQNKAREVEYRSHAQTAYLTAVQNAAERSYGFLRIEPRYASPRSANQELWIEGFPDPDMVLPDPEAKRPDSSDMQYCFVLEWQLREERARKARGATAGSGSQDHLMSAAPPAWVQGKKTLHAEYWCIETTPRTLLLVQPPMPASTSMMPRGPQRMQALAGQQAQVVPLPAPVQIFEDEFLDLPVSQRGTLIRELRPVDYPKVMMYLTDGLDILHETAWKGKYIPIVSCYGKILYVPEGGEVKKKILSMTRFGRAPWKAFCYACCQELEVLGQVPKTPLMAYRGQMNPAELQAVADSLHTPTAALTFGATADGMPAGAGILPPPSRNAYIQGDYLQAIEMVKEGFRRSIQAAIAQNFLPSDAQKVNQKTGVAMDKIEQAATTGSYHFIKARQDLVRMTGIIFEDLCDKYYDYNGQTGVMDELGKAQTIFINDPHNPEAISTKGDYLVTVSTAPSSDSERQAASEFTETLVTQLPNIQQIVGTQVAVKLLAQSIKLRLNSPQGDALAEVIDPTPPEGQQAPTPREQQLQAALQQAQQQLQKLGVVIQTKQVEQQGKVAITHMQETAETARQQATDETRLAIAALTSKVETLQTEMKLFYEERARIGIEAHEFATDTAKAAHEARLAGHKDGTTASLAVHAAASEAAMQGREHAHALATQTAEHAHQVDQSERAFANQPVMPAVPDEGGQ